MEYDWTKTEKINDPRIPENYSIVYIEDRGYYSIDKYFKVSYCKAELFIFNKYELEKAIEFSIQHSQSEIIQLVTLLRRGLGPNAEGIDDLDQASLIKSTVTHIKYLEGLVDQWKESYSDLYQRMSQ